MTATRAIADKWQQLQEQGLFLGDKVGLEQDPGFDGRMQFYTNGRIYWHEQIGTFEVHGPILEKYLEYGASRTNPRTGIRELGFPTSDVTRTEDGLYPVSHFEGGAIFLIRGKTVCLHSEFYTEWRKSGGELGEWGYPISDPVDAAGGRAVYFERGCMWKGAASGETIVTCRFYPPLLGRPMIVSQREGEPLSLAGMAKWHLPGGLFESMQRSQPGLFEDVLSGFALQRVGATGARDMAVLQPRAAAQPEEDILDVSLVAAPGSLADRTLYNVVVALPEQEPYEIAPHALYSRASWDDFGILHATDLHVSRRTEEFRRKLREMGMAEGAEQFNNFNDGLRLLISYANSLHDEGKADLILVTGDVTDYVYERDDNRNGGGNFAYFEQIVRGQASSPEGEAGEELRVPIFTILGNHDYRPNGYDLLADLDLGDAGPLDWWPDWLYAPEKSRNINGYSSLNLTEDEARAIQGGPPNPLLDESAAFEMVRVDPESVRYYHQRINDDLSYLIELGPHRIVMVDSRWELGIVQGTFRDYVRFALNNFDEDSRNWLAQHPNCMGFEEYELELVRGALGAAEPGGLVLVGVHAPPINPSGDEWPHYFRETEHPTADPREIQGYLRRRDPKAFRPERWMGATPDPSKVYPHWIRTGTPYFKEGGIGDLLDYGIARGSTEEFLQLCVGLGVPRPVDLVMCGHIHTNVEYRLKWDPERRFLFFTDFYFQNPDRYYDTLSSLDLESGEYREDGIPATRIQIYVREGAQPGAAPTPIDDRHGRLEVPPYPSPLNEAPDRAAWWAERRPIIMQTSSLGSMDRNQRVEYPDVSFQGFRRIQVENNVIARVEYVTLKELRAQGEAAPMQVVPADVAARG
ncbi:MAG TPA: metallophosphoesterase [Chloroflexia bacterium]|nr:metallophosphoesterase [Chloroflexia bacterium]